MTPTIQAIRPGRRLRIFLVAIILVAAVGLLLPLLVTLIAPKPLTNISKSKHSMATAELAILAQQVSLYLLDENIKRPPGDIDLNVLTGGRNAYLRPQDLIDPWGRPYLFVPTPTGFTVSTLGNDGVPGGTGDDADVAQSIFNNE